MGKLEVIDGKRTTWEGLWWHPECQYFSSRALSLAQLRKFKGNVRLYVKKNKYYNNGENGRPNYTFSLCDANASNPREFEVEDIDDDDEFERLYTEDEVQEAIEKALENMYTYDQVQHAVNCAAEDGRRGYGWGDVLVSDYL